MRKTFLIFSLALAAGFFIFASDIYAGLDEVKEKTIVQKTYYYKFDFEYRGTKDWWIVTNDRANEVYFRPQQINITYGTLVSNGLFEMTETLPSSILEAMDAGAELTIEIVPGTASTNIYTNFLSWELSYSRFTMHLKPNLHIVKGKSISDYVSGMSVTIPLIDCQYGRNNYKVTRLSSTVTAYGFFDKSDYTAKKQYYVHPSQISNKKGAFKLGEIINNIGTSMSSLGWKIGDGAFYDAAGAILEFDCPVTLRFTAILTPAEDDDSGNSSSGGGSTPVVTPPAEDDPTEDDDNGQTGDDSGDDEGDDSPVIKPFGLRIHRVV